nr:restriction endonuclease subunit S [Listeria monocytogenes]
MPLFYVISHYSNLPFRAWEQRKLGEDVNFLNGRAYSQKELLDKGKYKVLRVGNFNTNDRWYYSDLELEENKYANRGDLLYLWATNFGPEIWNQEKVIYHYHIWKLKIMNINVSKQYLYTWLITDKERIKQSTNGTTMVHVTKGHIEQREFQIPPNLTEQQKIGTFFKQLDDTIALHQRKLDTLKRMKKGFLQQMFPNNEEEIPNVRFTDFDAMWEQRKLKSITEKITRKNKELESTLPLTISAQDGLIDQNEYFNKIVASRNIRGYFLVKNGEFAYNKSYSKGYPWGVVKRLDNYDMGVLSTLYIIFKPIKINSDFLTKYFDSTYWYRAVSQFATEGARNHGLLNIAASDFFEIELNIPLNNEEQKKIGLFFQQLENTLILHQNKLEKLSILKKTYLKKMFI